MVRGPPDGACCRKRIEHRNADHVQEWGTMRGVRQQRVGAWLHTQPLHCSIDGNSGENDKLLAE